MEIDKHIKTITDYKPAINTSKISNEGIILWFGVSTDELSIRELETHRLCKLVITEIVCTYVEYYGNHNIIPIYKNIDHKYYWINGRTSNVRIDQETNLYKALETIYPIPELSV